MSFAADKCPAPCCVSTVIQGFICVTLKEKGPFGLTLSQDDVGPKFFLEEWGNNGDRNIWKK